MYIFENLNLFFVTLKEFLDNLYDNFLSFFKLNKNLINSFFFE